MKNVHGILFGLFAVFAAAQARGGDSRGPVVLEADDQVVLDAMRREGAGPYNYFMVKNNRIANFVRWDPVSDRTRIVDVGGAVRPDDVMSEGYAFYRTLDEKERNAVRGSQFILVSQRKDKSKCLMNVLDGERVLKESLQEQNRTTREVSCREAVSYLRGCEFSPKSIKSVQLGFGLSLDVPDGGVAADGGR
jgi:hypothetical protein